MLNTSLNISYATDVVFDDVHYPLDKHVQGYEDTIEISTEAAAFASLPLVMRQALMQQRRIVCIANNPSIDKAGLAALLQPTDMLVLFNDFIHADYFAMHPVARHLPKLIFFRQIGDSALHFGLPPRSNNAAAISEMAKGAPLGILLSNQSYQFPSPTDDPRPNDDPITPNRILQIPALLKDLLHNNEHCGVLSEQHPVVADYPHFEDIHSSAPSSGFLLYRLLLAARLHVQRLQQTKAPLQILMLGFNDENKTLHFWQGHNWKFEREEMSKAPYGVSIVRQY